MRCQTSQNTRQSGNRRQKSASSRPSIPCKIRRFSMAASDPKPGRDTTQAVTRLLLQWTDGDAKALDQLLPLVYDELRRLAQSYLRRENVGILCKARLLFTRRICAWSIRET